MFMKLLPNEQIIKQSTDKEFALTNFRVVLESRIWFGPARNGNSIALENISSIERYDRSWLIFLVLGVITLLGGFLYFNRFANLAIFLVFGIVFLLIWWFTRSSIVRITPNGGRDIVIEVRRAGLQSKDLLFDIELARLNRIQQLYNSKF
mgnify:CR=1 FL=1